MDYTKGAWKARKLLPDKHGIITKEAWEVTTDEFDVATCIEHSAPIRREADARLIASAPDMYEALKVLIETYWKNRGNDGKTCPHPQEFIACITPKGIPDYWRKAEQALKKAEGK